MMKVVEKPFLLCYTESYTIKNSISSLKQNRIPLFDKRLKNREQWFIGGLGSETIIQEHKKLGASFCFEEVGGKQADR